jgi:hypothetical protein
MVLTLEGVEWQPKSDAALHAAVDRLSRQAHPRQSPAHRGQHR